MIFLIGFQSNYSTENKLQHLQEAGELDWITEMLLWLWSFSHLHFEYILSSCSFYNYIMVE